MTNHPNRRRGRPPIPPAERKRTIGLSLSPDVIEAIDALGPGKHPKVDAILREKLIG